MTNEEILKKAIIKATKNGFKLYDEEITKIKKVSFNEIAIYTKKTLGAWCNITEIIFSHKFAKAFWGEEEIPINTNPYPHEDCYLCSSISWQYHLREMVLEDHHIKYLEKFIK